MSSSKRAYKLEDTWENKSFKTRSVDKSFERVCVSCGDTVEHGQFKRIKNKIVCNCCDEYNNVNLKAWGFC
jgi:hypothetical protein